MTSDKLQIEDILQALDTLAAPAPEIRPGQRLGRRRDLGVFCFPGSDTDRLPAILPSEEEWLAMGREIQRNQDEAFRQNHPEMFSKNSGDTAGVVRKVSRA